MPNHIPSETNDLSQILTHLHLVDGGDASRLEEEVAFPKPHPRVTKVFEAYESYSRYNEALDYVLQVQERCWVLDEPEMYNKFLEALQRFRRGKLSAIGLRDEMFRIFMDAQELYTGFMKFMPHLGWWEDRFLIGTELYEESMVIDEELRKERMEIYDEIEEDEPQRNE